MKHGKPLARSTRLQRGKPKRKPPSMQDLAHPKPTTYPFNEDFLAWLRTQRCVACRLGSVVGLEFCAIEAAHLDSRQYGDEGNAISLHGLTCHREGGHSLHRMGREKFAAYWELHLRETAHRQFAQYQAEQLGDTFMRAFE